ncbi:MAG: phosphatidate cytidylyltransferase [Acidobacteriota bacterium]
MTRVLSGAVLIIFAVVVVWLAPLPVFEAVAVAMLFAAAEELITLFTASGIRVPRWPSVVGALVTLLAFSEVIGARRLSLDVVLMVELVVLAIVALASWRGGSDALAAMSGSLFPSLYLAIPLGAMVAIRESGGAAALSLLMLTVIVSDTSQYYTGRMFGRRLLAPAVSPKKTVEGAIGGFVFGTAVFAAVGTWWLPIVPVVARIGIGLGIVAVGIAGDLFESMLKRSANVKDSSAIIPGHGGILDRIDALLFAAPFFYVVGRFIPR